MNPAAISTKYAFKIIRDRIKDDKKYGSNCKKNIYNIYLDAMIDYGIMEKGKLSYKEAKDVSEKAASQIMDIAFNYK